MPSTLSVPSTAQSQFRGTLGGCCVPPSILRPSAPAAQLWGPNTLRTPSGVPLPLRALGQAWASPTLANGHGDSGKAGPPIPSTKKVPEWILCPNKGLLIFANVTLFPMIWSPPSFAGRLLVQPPFHLLTSDLGDLLARADLSHYPSRFLPHTYRLQRA